MIEESANLGVKANMACACASLRSASSKWADTGGDKGEFGLSAAQLIPPPKSFTAAGFADTVKLMQFTWARKFPIFPITVWALKRRCAILPSCANWGCRFEYVRRGRQHGRRLRRHPFAQ